ncbi:MAG: cell division protein FtsZ [Flavobacteriales bacterium]|nr:cell division protein FtsZ [Flavobacteriales bacterium]
MSLIDTDFEFQLPKNQSSQIKVMGVGGGGGNAVNYMFEHGIKGVDFVICNTDLQALEASLIPTKIQLGKNLTEGLGAGSDPDVGMKAAQESSDRISELLDANTKMLFITAGMGGGTGTGAAPVIAEIAREKGILTIAVVTHPFANEGGYRKQYAKDGLEELKKYVDTLLVINNDKLIEIYGDLTFTQAFGKANEVLNTATKGIAEVISQHMVVNIDLNDARKVLENSGTALMGQAISSGENRAIEAVTAALDSPLLNDNDITGAEQVLLKIVSGEGDDEIRISELEIIKNQIQKAAGRDVNIIEGIGNDASLEGAVSITVIATGFETKKVNEPVTIKLEDTDDIGSSDSNDLEIINNNVQQKLSLEDDESFDFKHFKSNEVEAQTIVESDKKVVGLEEDESFISEPEALISDILELNNEDPDSEKKVVVSEDITEKETLEFHKPTINEEEKLNSEQDVQLVDNKSMRIEAREREERLREISIKLRTPSGLTKLEDEPAYKRNNIDLEETAHSSEDEISHFSLTSDNEEKIILNDKNSFLHDNVD